MIETPNFQISLFVYAGDSEHIHKSFNSNSNQFRSIGNDLMGDI